ncbi:MAG: hypothetical protein R3251_03790 [Candidatus Spechtbacterales bacterium]|nr:hypothetical protein [Candidatus Spechtbacterales bacterium]
MRKLFKWSFIGLFVYIFLQVIDNMLKDSGREFRAPLAPRRQYSGSITIPVSREALDREYNFEDMDRFIESVQKDIHDL